MNPRPEETTALTTRSGDLALPAFLPDATRGVVRGIDAADLRAVGVAGLMVNAFHLSLRPGARVVQHLGGLHAFLGWDGPIVSDSGGFQVLSLIRKHRDRGTIREDGVIFRHPEDGKKTRLTPEKSIQVQLQLGSNVLVALDDCTDGSADADEQARAVDRTIRWFRAARAELDRQLAQRRVQGPKPLLVGVVQGGTSQALRKRCAQALADVGADGFGFGGWPISAEGQLQIDMFDYLLSMVPKDRPFFALGVGKPEHLVAIRRLSARVVFDCTLPTRDARHHRLYVWKSGPSALRADARDFYDHLYILDRKHVRSREPICAHCDCPCCRRYSRGYLHHLSKVGDTLAQRLSTLHNLRFYTQLIERLSQAQVPDVLGTEHGIEAKSP